MSIASLIEKLHTATDGVELDRIVRKLVRSAGRSLQPDIHSWAANGRGWGQGLRLYGAGELIEAQHGYSDVIATEAGDPYVVDLSAAARGDGPVLTAGRGQGTWDFGQAAARFSTFLQRLGART